MVNFWLWSMSVGVYLDFSKLIPSNYSQNHQRPEQTLARASSSPTNKLLTQNHMSGFRPLVYNTNFFSVVQASPQGIYFSMTSGLQVPSMEDCNNPMEGMRERVEDGVLLPGVNDG
ncbi:hypothetical protein Y1Q_0003825 [Alligator mississippiensis]|uniref:Uncharacterized protein n=1 Tax=Alligator mississippiensis TaxID=8496 RepID=A0A151MNH7_ALLMI|nr:hypothetical protein Y1Q_0003825 [Alligator mississippiensis]